MANFATQRTFTTDQPTITVDVGLPVGEHRFQLVVIDKDGLRSAPIERVVTIVERPIIVDTLPDKILTRPDTILTRPTISGIRPTEIP